MERRQSVTGNLPRDASFFYDDSSYKIIDSNDFDTVYGIIKYPKNAVLYRGYDKRYKVLSDRPIYLTPNKSNAEEYAKQDNCELGIFVIKEELRLFDLRFMKHILQDLIQQDKINTNTVKQVCYTLAPSFGLCSLKRQIELIKQRFPNPSDPARRKNLEDFVKHPNEKDPVELQGVRVGETYNDAQSALYLKEAFEDVIHGYIAPRLSSPYHYENDNIHPAEILLFNPSRIRITQLMREPNELMKCNVSDLFSNSAIHFPLRRFKDPKLRMMGGHTNPAKDYEIIYKKNEYFDKLTQKEYQQLTKKSKQSFKKLTGNTKWTYGEVPHPMTPVSPWTT